MILASGALLKRDMRKGMEMGKSRVIALLAVASIVATACSGSSNSASPSPAAPTGAVPSTGASSAASAPAASPVVGTSPTPNVDTTVYNRATTLYTSGKQWGAPSTWNPLDPNAAMGVVGLQYETLFLYDPIKDVYTPWLAQSGKGMEMGKSRVIALLAVASIVATACSGSSNSASPSPAAPTGAVPSTGASSAASAPPRRQSSALRPP